MNKFFLNKHTDFQLIPMNQPALGIIWVERALEGRRGKCRETETAPLSPCHCPQVLAYFL